MKQLGSRLSRIYYFLKISNILTSLVDLDIQEIVWLGSLQQVDGLWL